MSGTDPVGDAFRAAVASHRALLAAAAAMPGLREPGPGRLRALDARLAALRLAPPVPAPSQTPAPTWASCASCASYADERARTRDQLALLVRERDVLLAEAIRAEQQRVQWLEQLDSALQQKRCPWHPPSHPPHPPPPPDPAGLEG